MGYKKDSFHLRSSRIRGVGSPRIRRRIVRQSRRLGAAKNENDGAKIKSGFFPRSLGNLRFASIASAISKQLSFSWAATCALALLLSKVSSYNHSDSSTPALPRLSNLKSPLFASTGHFSRAELTFLGRLLILLLVLAVDQSCCGGGRNRK